MDLSYHTFGMDPEALARSCSLLGGDVDLLDLSEEPNPNRRYGSVPYIMDWLDASLAADFLKSLAPEKPFYDSEFHVTRDDHPVTNAASAKAHLETALWLAHLHGMSANLAWYWSRNADGSVAGAEWFRGSLLQQPWTLQGSAQGTLSLSRFVREVQFFAQEPRPVRLLYSEASAIQDVGYLDTLRDAYEALNFLGVFIGILTERQLGEHGVPAGTRLVIVPNARYAQDPTVAALKASRHCPRVAVVQTPGCQGLRASRLTPRRLTTSTLSTGLKKQVSTEKWSPSTPAEGQRGASRFGRRARGGRRFAYAVNLLRQPVKVTLRWRANQAQWCDCRSGATLPRQVTLSPRQLLFGSY